MGGVAVAVAVASSPANLVYRGMTLVPKAVEGTSASGVNDANGVQSMRYVTLSRTNVFESLPRIFNRKGVRFEVQVARVF